MVSLTETKLLNIEEIATNSVGCDANVCVRSCVVSRVSSEVKHAASGGRSVASLSPSPLVHVGHVNIEKLGESVRAATHNAPNR